MVTQTLLDVARDDPNGDTGELVDRLRAVNGRAIDLTEALLLLSRADQRSFSREHVDLSLLAEEAIETLLPLAEERGLTLEISGAVTPTIGSQRAPAAADDEPRAERDRPQPAGTGFRVGHDQRRSRGITQAHDGTLTLNPRAAGGLRVTVQLPAAAGVPA